MNPFRLLAVVYLLTPTSNHNTQKYGTYGRGLYIF